MCFVIIQSNMNKQMSDVAGIMTTIIVIAIIGSVVGFILFVGHVPDTKNYPHETRAEPSPLFPICIDQPALRDYQMTCSTLHALLQPAK